MQHTEWCYCCLTFDSLSLLIESSSNTIRIFNALMTSFPCPLHVFSVVCSDLVNIWIWYFNLCCCLNFCPFSLPAQVLLYESIFIAAANRTAKGNGPEIILPEKWLLVLWWSWKGCPGLASCAEQSSSCVTQVRRGMLLKRRWNQDVSSNVLKSHPQLYSVQWLSNWLFKSEGFFCPVCQLYSWPHQVLWASCLGEFSLWVLLIQKMDFLDCE